MSDAEARETDSGFGYKRENRVPAIIKVYVTRKGLTCKLDTNSPGGDILKLVTSFNSSIETMNLQNFNW